MNIQRYKWPVVVAAGLHGALFLGSPRGPIPTREPPEKPIELKSIPLDSVVLPPDQERTGNETGGSPGVKELPEPDAPIPEKTNFVMPRTEIPSTTRSDTLIDHRSSVPGDGLGPITVGGPTPINWKDLDRHPRATAQTAPDYPLAMQQQGIGGTVMVDFEVNSEGKVVRAEAASFTRREFVEAALRAVRNWRFEPGKRDGRPVSFRMTVPIEFGLDGK